MSGQIGRWDFNPNGALERDARKAERARRVVPRGRMVRVNGRRYVAFSAHELLEFESDNDKARPGHPG